MKAQFNAKLKFLRGQQSITSLAKALVVDRSYLNKVENGYQKPSKSLVEKIIAYFSLSYEDAKSLRHSVGINLNNDMNIDPETNDNTQKEVSSKMDVTPNPAQKEIEVNVPDNLPILYSDAIYLSINPYGLVFDFAQSLATTNKQKVVSRIGLSIPHAKVLLKLFQEKIRQAEEMNEKTFLERSNSPKES